MSVSLVAAAWRNLLVPEADLAASFKGPLPPEALSFWPSWSVVLGLQLLLLVLAWRFMAKAQREVLMPMLVCAFVVASVLEHRSFERDQAVWSAAVYPQSSSN